MRPPSFASPAETMQPCSSLRTASAATPMARKRRGSSSRLWGVQPAAPLTRPTFSTARFAQPFAMSIGASAVHATALPGGEIEEIDGPARDVELAIGDVILLMSDGLNTLRPAEIECPLAETAEQGAEAMATALIAAVLAQGRPRQHNADAPCRILWGTSVRPRGSESLGGSGRWRSASRCSRRNRRRRHHDAKALVPGDAIVGNTSPLPGPHGQGQYSRAANPQLPLGHRSPLLRKISVVGCDSCTNSWQIWFSNLS
jgi:hypothetical protein